ncbi:hypothetical protein PR048_008774 [Dryococelus australis]|uniref:Uncharacterized protein n=1 Tax=Dryococelus australis TaxID=614101 RepID=A0ABQ9HY27_9NEOP|nr:hypothetical protein PR048_008774 [Dryococelus australis]
MAAYNRMSLDGRSGVREFVTCWSRTKGCGDVVVRLLASHPCEPGSIPGWVTSALSHVGIVTNDAAGRRVFSVISRFPRPFTPALLHTHHASPSWASPSLVTTQAHLCQQVREAGVPAVTCEVSWRPQVGTAKEGGQAAVVAQWLENPIRARQKLRCWRTNSGTVAGQGLDHQIVGPQGIIRGPSACALRTWDGRSSCSWRTRHNVPFDASILQAIALVLVEALSTTFSKTATSNCGVQNCKCIVYSRVTAETALSKVTQSTEGINKHSTTSSDTRKCEHVFPECSSTHLAAKLDSLFTLSSYRAAKDTDTEILIRPIDSIKTASTRKMLLNIRVIAARVRWSAKEEGGGRGGVVVRRLASHLDELVSIPGGFASRFPQWYRLIGVSLGPSSKADEVQDPATTRRFSSRQERRVSICLLNLDPVRALLAPSPSQFEGRH